MIKQNTSITDTNEDLDGLNDQGDVQQQPHGNPADPLNLNQDEVATDEPEQQSLPQPLNPMMMLLQSQVTLLKELLNQKNQESSNTNTNPLSQEARTMNFGAGTSTANYSLNNYESSFGKMKSTDTNSGEGPPRDPRRWRLQPYPMRPKPTEEYDPLNPFYDKEPPSLRQRLLNAAQKKDRKNFMILAKEAATNIKRNIDEGREFLPGAAGSRAMGYISAIAKSRNNVKPCDFYNCGHCRHREVEHGSTLTTPLDLSYHLTSRKQTKHMHCCIICHNVGFTGTHQAVNCPLLKHLETNK